MITFADTRWLWGLVSLVPLLLLEWRAARRAERALDALVGLRPGHVLLSQRRTGQRRAGALLRLLALAFLFIAAAGPEWGREVVRRGATGSDVVFVVDVSASMDARDVPPNRLGEARREALAVLERLGGSRIGVVAFAGDAVRVCPLTLERSAVRLSLESLHSASVSTPGTDLGRALRMVRRVMPGGRRDEQAVVLWTDGEDLEAGARDAIEELKAAGIRVFAIGVGTAAGDVVPLLDAQGRAVDVKRDERGGPVRSRLDEELLRTLARRTGGGYFEANRPGGELPRLLSALSGVARSARGERLVERPVARFPWFAGLAALLLALDRIRKKRRAREPGGTRKRARMVAAPSPAMLLLAACGALAWLLLFPRVVAAQSAWAKGNAAFKAGRYAEAESLYAMRMRSKAPDGVRVNRATARALAGEAGTATQELAAVAEKNDQAGRMAGYNLGTVLGEQNDIERGLEELRRSLERDPDDADARWNYEVLLQRQRQAAERPPDRPEQNPAPPETPSPTPAEREQGPANPNQGQGAPSPAPQGPPDPGPPSGSQRMDRSQAERLLGALEELQRLERQRQQRVRVMQERRGRDW